MVKKIIQNSLCMVILLLEMGEVWGQSKQQSSQILLWPHYQFSGKISDKWHLSSDISYRWKDYDQKSQFIIRAGIGYKVSSLVDVTGGYAYYVRFPTDTGVTVSRPEHRLWQQVSLSSNPGRLQVQHRYRVEERWIRKMNPTELLPGYALNFRVRYQLSVQCALKAEKLKTKSPYILFADEIMFNFGEKIVYNHFDQNRVHVALGYKFSENFSASLGYMYIYQQRPSGNKFEHIHVVPRLVVQHNADLRKKSHKE